MGLSSVRIYAVPQILRRDVECFIVNEFDGEERAAGRITVKSLLEALDISERQFERRFSQNEFFYNQAGYSYI